MSYKTVRTTVRVEVDTQHRHCYWDRKSGGTREVGPTFHINGEIEFEVSITRDNGNYGSGTDDYPGDPDEFSIEEVVDYELWIKNLDEDPDVEGTKFVISNPLLSEDFLLKMIPNVEDLEVSYHDCD